MNSLLIVVFIFLSGLMFIFIFKRRDQRLLFYFVLMFFSTKVAFGGCYGVVHASSNKCSMWGLKALRLLLLN
mgnify:CR=1 FL=1